MYDIIVIDNLIHFRPSTRKREARVCKNLFEEWWQYSSELLNNEETKKAIRGIQKKVAGLNALSQ